MGYFSSLDNINCKYSFQCNIVVSVDQYDFSKKVVKNLVIVSIIGLLLGSGLFFLNREAPWGYVDYEGNGFKIKYPRGWAYPNVNVSENKGRIKIGGENDDLGGIWILWFNEGDDVEFKTLVEYLDDKLDTLAAHYTEDNWIRLDYRETFTIDEHEGLIQYIDTSLDGESIRTMDVIWTCNVTNRRVSLTVAALPDYHDKISNTLIKDFECH